MLKTPYILAAAALFLISSQGVSQAASVFVSNFSFEEQILSNGGYTTTVTGWTLATGKAGAEHYAGTTQFTNTNPLAAPADGNQGAYTNTAGMIYQDVGTLSANTLYTLTVAVGNRLDQGSAQNGGTIYLYNGTSNTGTLLTSSNNFIAAAGTFQDLTITFQTGSAVSGDLTIAMKQTSGNNTIFDNVRLTATPVPEPSIFALLPALGGLSLLRRRSR